FPVPRHGFKWHATRQPIVIDLWKTDRGPKRAAVFTSIANWSTSGLKDITWRRQKYLWSKSCEFLRFVAAPKNAGETFELATNNYGGDAGLLVFRSLGEIAEAVKMINRDYAKHAAAARQIAQEMFEAEKVLKSLLDRAGI